MDGQVRNPASSRCRASAYRRSSGPPTARTVARASTYRSTSAVHIRAALSTASCSSPPRSCSSTLTRLSTVPLASSVRYDRMSFCHMIRLPSRSTNAATSGRATSSGGGARPP